MNRKLQDILGLDYRQFKQVSMIAQGEFMNLLLAKSDMRSEIFRKVFDTEFYKLISDRLKNMSIKEREEEKLREERRRQVLESWDVLHPDCPLADRDTEEILRSWTAASASHGKRRKTAEKKNSVWRRKRTGRSKIWNVSKRTTGSSRHCMPSGRNWRGQNCAPVRSESWRSGFRRGRRQIFI
ncbi:MAG: hypothetical protein ACLRMZ_17725 [Blautia marasmi]